MSIKRQNKIKKKKTSKQKNTRLRPNHMKQSKEIKLNRTLTEKFDTSKTGNRPLLPRFYLWKEDWQLSSVFTQCLRLILRFFKYFLISKIVNLKLFGNK